MVSQQFFNVPLRENSCLVCAQQISNPICPTCLLHQIEAWLTSYPNLKQRLLPSLRKYVRAAYNRSDSLIDCFTCKDKRASLCPYCFTDHTLNLLKKLQVHKQIIIEFIRFFNFDLSHQGYSKRAYDNEDL